MLKIQYFDYCALIILAILIISTVFRKMTNGKTNRWFLVMLGIAALSVIADIAAVYFDTMGNTHEHVKYFAHTLYLILHSLFAPSVFLYSISLTDVWHRIRNSLWRKIIFSVPIILILVEFMLNPFLDNVFYLDADGTYVRGSNFFTLYVVAALYLGYSCFYLIRYRRFFNRERFVSLISLFPFVLFSVIIQFFFPYIIVEMFATSCALLFISMMVQRPEDIIDVETGLGRISAYMSTLRHGMDNDKQFEIIMLNVANYASVREMLSYDGTNKLLKLISAQLMAVDKKWELDGEWYYLGSGKFRCVVDSKSFDKTHDVAVWLNTLFKGDFSYNQMDINLVTPICVVRCPDLTDNVESIIAFGSDLSRHVYTGKVLDASKLFKKEHYDLMNDIDSIIEKALAEHRFEMYYQPIYSVGEKRFNSAEALLRLKNEKYGFISPEIFIPAAEKSGAIHKIGEFVMDEVFRFISSDEYKSLGLDYIEINLSAVQCMQNDLCGQVLEKLKKHGVLPSQINLEITETAASIDQKTMADNLTALHNAGIGLSLDDFGTGYSNMVRIASLPISIVKLDKSFTNLQGNPKLRIILKNSIKMIKSLDMKIVVEGIETEETVKYFSDLKCEYIQGYYYSKPLPKDKFTEFIINATEH